MVFSARAIPGNEKPIGELMNHLARRGANVIYEGIKHVHVSVHGSEEELLGVPETGAPAVARGQRQDVDQVAH